MVHHKHGCIEVITGPMFSGKTEEMIRRLRRLHFARVPFMLFKPEIDARYSATEVATHVGERMPSIPVSCIDDIRRLITEAPIAPRAIAIDEIQFFPRYNEFLQEQASLGRRVIVSGLDMDYLGRPFGDMPVTLAIAEHVTKLQGVCRVCGEPASFTHRVGDSEDLVLVGADGMYEARCREHYPVLG